MQWQHDRFLSLRPLASRSKPAPFPSPGYPHLRIRSLLLPFYGQESHEYSLQKIEEDKFRLRSDVSVRKMRLRPSRARMASEVYAGQNISPQMPQPVTDKLLTSKHPSQNFLLIRLSFRHSRACKFHIRRFTSTSTNKRQGRAIRG